MSKYTTEVRYICETEAGLTESAGLNSVDNIIDNSWNKIFKDPDIGGPVIGSAAYQAHICKLILQHYYTREICAETVGLWKLWLRSKMDEIAPYYDGVYRASAAVTLERALQDVDYTRTHTGQSSHENETGSSETGSSTGRQTNTGTVTDAGSYSHDDRYSDTPQGAITELTAGRYLTNARLVSDTNGNTRTDNTQSDTTGSTTRSVSGTEEGSTTDSYTDRTYGKMGGKSFTELMTDYRAAILPIDQMIIDEFKDLFMQIW